MTADPIADLQAAVKILTSPHQVIVEDHDGRVLGLRTELGLLTKLRAAVMSSQETGGGGGSEKRTRAPLNVGALDLIALMSRKARKWYLDELTLIGFSTEIPSMRLEAMFINWANLVIRRYRSDTMEETSMQVRIGAIKGFIQAIRDLLDPNYRFELDAPCPICGELFVSAENPLGQHVRRRALVVTELDPLEESYVTCGNCQHRWNGISEARALSIAIDQGRAA